MMYKKRGVSTILGTLIFIGILFTAVIPMQLVMKQADSLYVRKIKEVEIADEERANEDLRVTMYPNPLNTSELYIHVENRGEVPVTIVRVWFNDDYHNDDTFIKAMDNEVSGPFPVSLQNDTYYNIHVTTERGNIFNSRTGSVYYSDGTWYTPALSITVFILNEQGQYQISVKNETQHQIAFWDSGGIVHDDVIQSFEVEESGIYHVTMKKKHSGEFKELAASPTTVEITWPDGPPLVYVYGDGNELKE